MRVRKFLCIVFACFMLVNCLGISAGAANEARSSWARNLDVGKTYHVSENSSIATNHYYYCEVSSDLLSSGDTDVTIYFSADNVSW